MESEKNDSASMRIAFWTWMGIIVLGLAAAIIVPLSGR